mgnify:FL=1
MVHCGIFDIFARVLQSLAQAPAIPPHRDSESQEEATVRAEKKKLLKQRIQAQVAACSWTLCIAHMQNKEKAKVLVVPMLSLLAHEDNVVVLYFAGTPTTTIPLCCSVSQLF